MFPACPGWVPERSIGHAWKACVPQGTEGSNPSPSERALHLVQQIKYVAVMRWQRSWFLLLLALAGALVLTSCMNQEGIGAGEGELQSQTEHPTGISY